MASRRYCGTSIKASGEFRSFTLPKMARHGRRRWALLLRRGAMISPAIQRCPIRCLACSCCRAPKSRAWPYSVSRSSSLIPRPARRLLRTVDRSLGTQALHCIVGKDGAVITPRYRRRKVVDHAFAHSESAPYSGEQQKGHRRVRRSATASHVGMIRNP